MNSNINLNLLIALLFTFFALIVLFDRPGQT